MIDLEVEPQRVIHRLLRQLGEATLEAAKYGAMCDQLTEQNDSLVKQLEARPPATDAGGDTDAGEGDRPAG